MRSLLRRWCGALLAVVLFAGCGIPVDSQPRDINDPNPSTTTPNTKFNLDSIGGSRSTVFFVAPVVGRGDRLRPLRRKSNPDLTATITELLKGVDSSEDKILRTAIPLETTMLHASQTNGIASIDLSQAFFKAQNDQLIRALAQLVFTATELEGVTSVIVLVDGKPRDWPRGDGVRQSQPLARSDFAELDPSSQPDYVLAPSPG